MPATESAMRDLIRYADAYGDENACKDNSVKQETIDRYRRKLEEIDSDRLEFKDLFKGKKRVNWSEHPKLSGNWLLLNDIHCPFFDVELLKKSFQVADLLRIKQVAILGDFVDCEAISKFDFGADTFSIMDELYIGRDLLHDMGKRFDKIFLLRGNHDERIIKFLKRIKRLFEAGTTDDESAAYHAIIGVGVSKKPWEQYRDFFQSDNVEVSNWAKCEIAGKYIGLHPSNYSRIPPSVEKKMCNKYLKHVIGTHGHLSAIGFHDSAQFIAIQLGGLVDEEYIFYKQMRETTHPEWVKGFGWIKDGKLGYYFDHPDLMQIFDYVDINRNGGA